MAREDCQMYQLMREAVVGKRFKDRWGRTYSVRDASIYQGKIFVDYEGEASFRDGIIGFYDCLGDEPLEETKMDDGRLGAIVGTQ
ncbi:MAG: hypothetical protein KKC19_03690 [Nanoarchaeota archaeon]|nr:hypothetical protein [Nanoarchaeota archaeon]